MDVNIIVNIDGEGNVKTKGLPVKPKGLPVKVKKRKLRNGVETILEMPEAQENTNPKPGILQMMGI